MTWVICIPSYKRPVGCRDKTLTMLKTNRIPKSSIYVFVANKKEKEEYADTIPTTFYNEIVIGVKGLVAQRAFITKYFPENKEIVFFDDDVTQVDRSLSPRFKAKSLSTFFTEAFRDCKEKHAYLWGVYPVFNPFFRTPTQEQTTSLKFIAGPCYGIINRVRTKAVQLTLTRKTDQKEDVERTIKYFIHDGIVIRYNKIGVKTHYYSADSAYGTFTTRKKTMKEAAHRLKKAYPTYGVIYTRKTGMTEFKLHNLPAFTP